MICPYCKKDDNYVYGGKNKNNGDYKRFRKCNLCGKNFKTYEYYVEERKGKK